MKDMLKTFISFTKNIKTTGAFYKTSKQVEKEICSKITADTRLIVEFGAGQGNITKRILEKMPADAKLISFEVNAEFCEEIKEEITDKRLLLVNDSALEFPKFTESKKVDIFVSSVPLSIMDKQLVNSILNTTIEHMDEHSFFSQIMYSKVLHKRFKSLFSSCDYVRTLNLPPGFVFHCKK